VCPSIDPWRNFRFFVRLLSTARSGSSSLESMAKQKRAAQASDRRPGGYPFNTYSQCAGLLSVIHDCGGSSGTVPKTVVAQALGVADSSSGFYALLASAKTFGMIDGNRDITLTTAARDYVLPTSENSRRLAELTFFSTPAAFRFLIERFDGSSLPASKMIASLLLRSNTVPQSWAGRTAGIFVSAAEELRLVDRGFLRFGAAEHAIVGGARGAASNEVSAGTSFATPDRLATPVPGIGNLGQATVTQPVGSMQTAVVAADANVWVYTEGGGTVTVKSPNPLPRALWERLTKYVEMLEPAKGKEG